MKVYQIPITTVVTILISKLLGILFSVLVFSIEFEISGFVSLFNLKGLADRNDLVILSSYSDLFMFTVVSTVLVISLMVHSKNSKSLDNKTNLDKFYKANNNSQLKSAYYLYGNSLYWLLSIWITNLYILFNTLTGKTYLWIYVLVLVLTISLSLYFYYDFRKESELAKNKLMNG
jgi:hypothetical protein